MIAFKSYASSSSGNCHVIDDGQTKILIECGIRFKEIQKALNFKLSNISGVLLSHSHADHSKSVKDIMKAGIDCYTSDGCAKALELSGHRLHIIQAKKQFIIGESWIVLPFDIVHNSPDPFGFLIANEIGEKLVYITDSAYCPYRFNELTLIAIEANYSEKLLKENKSLASVVKQQITRSHFSLENVKDFLKSNDLSKVREIHLLHSSDANSNAEMFKREIQELTGKPTFIA